ncbi:MAG: NAD(P)/FAD-dependent oxidoreductase [Patescibacteria group bacterium]
MEQKENYDVIVVGGGPSGMMAAGRAASRGRKVLLLEKNKSLGNKLSLTGGGRCNILNAEEDKNKLLDRYGEAKKFLYSPFSQFTMEDAWDFFQNQGLPLVVEARKRAFPKSQKASDVIRTMEGFTKKNGVKVKRGVKVKGFEVEKEKIVSVRTDRGVFNASSFILSTGGTSYPDTGSTGEGLRWLKSLGHNVNSSKPDLVPLVVKERWVKELSGITLSFMKITFGTDKTKKEGKFSRTGKILFTHFGLSGPLILNSSRKVKELLSKGPVKVEIDMYPDTDSGSLRKRLFNLFERNKNKSVKNVLSMELSEGLSEAVISLALSDLSDKKVHSITKMEREKLADTMKAMPLVVTDTMGLNWAIASDDGVDLREIDTKTMQSKIHPELYLTGDVLNIEKASGGFSLQWCWTSGWVAGSHA